MFRSFVQRNFMESTLRRFLICLAYREYFELLVFFFLLIVNSCLIGHTIKLNYVVEEIFKATWNYFSVTRAKSRSKLYEYRTFNAVTRRKCKIISSVYSAIRGLWSITNSYFEYELSVLPTKKTEKENGEKKQHIRPVETSFSFPQ